MLQRIQSIWLLLAGAFTATTFRFPFYSGMLKPEWGATVSFELNAQSDIWITVLTALICGLSFVTIFLYGNRKLQLRFTIAGLLLALGLLTLYVLHLGRFATGVMALSSVFYFAIPVCFLMAARGIVRDERLLRSMDRLR